MYFNENEYFRPSTSLLLIAATAHNVFLAVIYIYVKDIANNTGHVPHQRPLFLSHNYHLVDRESLALQPIHHVVVHFLYPTRMIVMLKTLYLNNNDNVTSFSIWSNLSFSCSLCSYSSFSTNCWGVIPSRSIPSLVKNINILLQRFYLKRKKKK